MTSFRGQPQTPTPASSEYQLTSDSYYCSALSGDRNIGKPNQTFQLYCTEEIFDVWNDVILFILVQIFGHLCGDELSLNSVWLLLFFSSEVQSILNLSPPQDPELMNTNPSPPVSKMNCAIYGLIIHVMAPTFFNHLCPSLTAQSIPTDQPRPIIQSFGQAQRLPLPQGYRQGQLRKGFACTPSHG